LMALIMAFWIRSVWMSIWEMPTTNAQVISSRIREIWHPLWTTRPSTNTFFTKFIKKTVRSFYALRFPPMLQRLMLLTIHLHQPYDDPRSLWVYSHR
jgi:hypothetical protein